MNGRRYQVVAFEGGKSVLDIATDDLRYAKNRMWILEENDHMPAIVADMSDRGRVVAQNGLYRD